MFPWGRPPSLAKDSDDDDGVGEEEEEEDVGEAEAGGGEMCSGCAFIELRVQKGISPLTISHSELSHCLHFCLTFVKDLRFVFTKLPFERSSLWSTSFLSSSLWSCSSCVSRRAEKRLKVGIAISSPS